MKWPGFDIFSFYQHYSLHIQSHLFLFTWLTFHPLHFSFSSSVHLHSIFFAKIKPVYIIPRLWLSLLLTLFLSLTSSLTRFDHFLLFSFLFTLYMCMVYMHIYSVNKKEKSKKWSNRVSELVREREWVEGRAKVEE